MTKSQELMEQLEALKQEAQEIKDTASAQEIKSKLDAIKELKAQIKVQEELENEIKEDITNKTVKDGIEKMENKMDIRETKNYVDGFYNFVAGRPLTAEQKEVLNVIGTSGVPVPKSFQNKLVKKLEALNIMRKLATVISTATDTDIPVVSTVPSADWTAENGAFVEGDDTFGTITIKAFKLTRICKVSEEILADNTFDLESYLVDSFAQAIAKPEEAAFINGAGTTKPTGVFVESELGKTTTSATAITADEVIDLYYSLKRQYRENACFIMNDSTLKAIRKLKDSQGNYLWTQGFNGEPEQILGKPVYTSEFADEIATGKKVIVFGDMKFYNIADRGTRSFQRLNELYSANGQVGFRGYERVDGRLLVVEAVKHMKMA